MNKEQLRVLIYKGDYHVVKESGVGKAIDHQERALQSAGVDLAQDWDDDWSIVHINTVFPASLRHAKKAKKMGRKVVYYGHSTEEDFRNSFHLSNVVAPLFKKWICHCYKTGDVIITPSPYSKKLLESYGIDKPIYNLSNGIDTEFFKPDPTAKARLVERFGLDPNRKIVVSVGLFIKRKGILEFLSLAKDMPDVQFVWFGHTDLKLIPKEVSQAIRHKPSNVLFPGYVTSDILRDAYGGADCFLFLSHEETEGIVVLEALACQVPTIVRDIPVYNPWLVDGESVFKVRNDEEAKERLMSILSGQSPDLSQGARKLALSRSIQEVGRELIGIYEKAGLI
jgi:1,2-diacylglycerol-3-alpha-glucose alpha-1,2-glucosyltransferase